MIYVYKIFIFNNLYYIYSILAINFILRKVDKIEFYLKL